MKQRRKVDRRVLSVEGLEERRVLAASVGWDGPGAGSALLSYYIGQAPSGISQSTFETAVKTALKSWSDVAAIKFVQTTQPGLNNSLDFTFRSIDGSGGTLAQAYFPSDVNRGRLAGDVEFDSTDKWEVGNSLGNAAFDLVLVAVHEIGHALGLDHSSNSTAVLYPSVSASQSFKGLASADVLAIRALYAAAPSSTNSNTTSIGTTNTELTNTAKTNTRITLTPRFTFNSWFANWHLRFGRLNSGVDQLDSTIPTDMNLSNPLDVNLDDTVSPVDALIVINILNDHVQATIQTNYKSDTNGDGQMSPLDALIVINGLNDKNSTTEISIDTPDDSTTDGSGTGTDSDSDNDSDSDDDTDTEEPHDHRQDFGHFGRGGFGFPIVLGGGLTPDRVDRLFKNFDDNADGLLTEDEVPSRLWTRWVVDAVDTNNDSAVSVAEVNEAIRVKQQVKFDALDADSDGLLSRTELSARLWTKLSDANADTNADGGISFDELLAFQATVSMASGCDHSGSGERESSSTTMLSNMRRQSGFAAQFTSAIRSMTRRFPG